MTGARCVGRGLAALCVLGLVSLGLTSGCFAAREKARMAAPGGAMGAMTAPLPPAAPAAEAGGEGQVADKSTTAGGASSLSALTAQRTPAERKIIKSVEMSIEVKSVETAKQEIVRLYESVGGFADKLETTTQEGSPPRLEAVIRVPQPKFEAVLQQLRAPSFGVVRNEAQSGQDVTEEWVDVESRLRNLRREEQQFLEVLKKATRVKDILEVERELARVRGEIEQSEGRLKFLAHQVDYSTLTLHACEPAPVGPGAPSKWSPGTHALRAWRGLVWALEGLVVILIYFAIQVLPFLLVFALIVWTLVCWARRALRRARERRAPS